MRLLTLLLLLGSSACDAVLGIPDPSLVGDGSVSGADARLIDAPVIDAPEGTIDGSGTPDGAPDAPAGQPDAMPAPPVVFGWKTAFNTPEEISLFSGWVYARQVMIDTPGEVTKLGVDVNAGGSAATMGLYTNFNPGTGFQPGNSIAVSVSQVIAAAGSFEFSVSGTISTAGLYWIVIATQVTTPIDSDPGDLVYSCTDDRPYASAVPSGGFGGGVSCSSDVAIRVWVEVQP